MSPDIPPNCSNNSLQGPHLKSFPLSTQIFYCYMFLEDENEENEGSISSLRDKNVMTQEMLDIVEKNLSPHLDFDIGYFPGRTKRWYSLEFSVSPKIARSLYQTSREVFSSMLVFMSLIAVPANRHFELISLSLQ